MKLLSSLVLILSWSALLFAQGETPSLESAALTRARAANDLGVKEYGKKSYAKALRSFEAAVKEGRAGKANEKVLETYVENLFVAHLALVKNHLDAREWTRAENRLRVMVALRSKPDARVALWTGILWYRRGFPAAAADHLLTALRRDAKNATAHFFLGRIHYDREELERAIEAWERAATLDPDLSESIKGWVAKAKRELAVESRMQTQRSTHFVCKFADEQGRGVANTVLDWLEDIYVQVGQRYQVYPDRNLTVILYADREFRAATATHAWVGGLFDGKVRLPIKNFSRRKNTIRDTLAHEYTHFAIRRITPACPAWLNEGLAQLAESGNARRDDRDLARRAAQGTLIDFKKLDRSFVELKNQSQVPLAYAQSRSFCDWLVRTYTTRDVESLLRRLEKKKGYDAAFRAVYRQPLKDAVAAWKRSLSPR